MDPNEAFGTWLKRRRRTLDLTQEALAEQAGCSVQMIRRVEGSTARPSRQLAELLTAALQVPPAERAAYVHWARTGQHPAAGDNRPTAAGSRPEEPAATETAPTNPYKGLQAFQEADAADFFGRETLTRQLVGRLQEPQRYSRFLAVVGPSGSGKSSVVRAGLAPALYRGAVPQFAGWPVLQIVPGAHPLEEVEAGLLRLAVNPPASLLPQLQEDARGLLRAVKRSLPDPQHGLVLVLDQFEEVFTLVADEGRRRHFLASLCAAAAEQAGPLVVVATLRADFYDRPLGYRGMGELLRERSEPVLPLSAEELEKTIVLPAQSRGVRLESDLLVVILQDTVDQPGTLPLLQYALTELFDRREGRLMTLRAYRSSGGVLGALSRRAESIYAALNPEEQEEARQLFLRLVTLGEGVEDTRRRARRAEIAGAARDEQGLERVLELYGRHRLLTFDRDPVRHTPTVEVAHEALLQSWPRLRTWLDTSRESLRTHRRLIAATGEWAGAHQDPSFLAHGVRLAQFKTLQHEGNVALNAQERAYLQASREAEAQAEAEQEAQRQSELQAARQLAETQQRAATQLRRRAYFLVGVLVVALGLAGLATYLGARATALATAEQTARASAEQAGRLATSRELAAAALNNLDVDPERSILLSLQAISTTYGLDKTWTAEAENALHRSVLASHALLTVQPHRALISALAFSPDGRLLAVASAADETTKILDAATGKELFALPTFSSTVLPQGGTNSVTFSPDGRLLATAGDDTQIRLWDPQTGRLLHTLSDHQAAVITVRFSPDGTRLGSASADDTAKVWDVATGQELLTIAPHTQGVATISFSPDNKRIATGDFDNTVKTWDGVSGQLLFTINDAPPGFFSPDGTKIVTVGPNIWDGFTGKQLTSMCCHTNVINDVAWSPDGTQIASVSRDRTAKLWDAATGKELRTLSAHVAALGSVAFSGDGTRLATGDEDGTVKVWDLGPDHELMAVPVTLPRPTLKVGGFTPGGKLLAVDFSSGDNPTNGGQVRLLDVASAATVLTISVGSGLGAAVLSPDGKTIVTVGDPSATGVWSAATGHALYPFHDPTTTSLGAAFSGDGTRFATADQDHVARVWDTATGRQQLTLQGHTKAVWAVAFSPDGKRLLTASADHTARVWDLSTGQSLITLTGHTDTVFGVAYSPDGKRIATASRDSTAKLWDAATGKEVVTLKGHISTVFGVAFSPDGKRLATAGTDGTVKLWDVATGHELLSLPGTWGALFSPDGKRLAAGDQADSTFKVYTLPIEDLVSLAKSRLTRTWTPDECRTFLHTDSCPAP